MAVYRDIATTLRQRGLDGYYPDNQLPIQPDLAAEFQVAPSTIHRAIRLLKRDDIVYTTHAGTFFGPRPDLGD